MKTKIILFGLLLIICLVSFQFSLAQDDDIETKNEIKDPSSVEDNRSPEEKIREIEANTEMPTEIKTILISQIKNPQEKIDESALPKVNCTDYYKFQSVQVSLGSDKDIYSPGELVQLRGELINQNTYSVVDGNVFARVSRKNSNYHIEGNYIIDEILLAENISLKEGEVRNVEYRWNIPNDVLKGEYRVDYFFSVGKKFNLGGLPFSNEVVIGTTEFNINSIQAGGFFFDRSKTTVDNQPYEHIGSWPTIKPDQEVIIKQPINNTYEQAKEINISYNLYHWDSLNKNDLRDTKTETINIQPSSSQELTYVIPQMNDAVYYLQIIAQAGESKSIINIRLTSPQENIRLNYPAITKFPINKGDNFTLFSCFQNGSNINTKGRIEVVLMDKKDKEVGKFNYEGVITSRMLAEKTDIIANSDYDYLKLIAKIYDRNNNLADEYIYVYDCKDFNSCKMSQVQKSNPIKDSAKALMMIFVVAAVFVFGVVVVRGLANKKS